MRLFLLLTAGAAMAAQPAHWTNLPLSFEPDGARYLARGGGYTIQLTAGGMTLGSKDRPPLRSTLVGANPAPRTAAENRQTSTTSVLGWSDPLRLG
jgi:hypothetical protein